MATTTTYANRSACERRLDGVREVNATLTDDNELLMFNQLLVGALAVCCGDAEWEQCVAAAKAGLKRFGKTNA